MSAKPIAVSMGDPAGVGLEVAVRAFHARGAHDPVFYLIGDADALARAAARLDVSVQIAVISAPGAARADELCVLHTPLAAPERCGAPDPRHGPAIMAAIAAGVRACASGEAAALVTLPVSKASLYAAGFAFPGQTEFVAHLARSMENSGPRGPVMMLAARDLKVGLVTSHTPLSEAPQALTCDRIVAVGRVLVHALQRDFAIARPRIALAALNPHAGEGGALGREEIDITTPAAALLRAEGHDVSDARPAEALFHEEARATYDAVIAMYHDQGLIPIKTLDFWGAVNVTLGLPIVRTSPDHGTGLDIAGQGRARPDSFIAALRMAADMAARRG